MATYWFHLRNHSDLLLDPEGRELEYEQVRDAALAEARAIISADARSGMIDLDQAIEVEDSGKVLVHRIAFEDAVEIRRPS